LIIPGIKRKGKGFFRGGKTFMEKERTGIMNPLARVSLNGTWNIRQLNGKISLKGQVPGLVHHDLVKKQVDGLDSDRKDHGDF
jgi:hypothetical protein